MIEEDKLRDGMQRISDLVRRLDEGADPAVRVQVRELLRSVMDLHGGALGRVVERLRGFGEAGTAILDSLATDAVVASVLLLYGLHPVDFETRVRNALQKLQPALRAQGVITELTGARGGDVRIRIRGVDDADTARTVRSLVEEEMYAAAPDAASLTLIGLEKFTSPDFVPLENLGAVAAGKAGR